MDFAVMTEPQLGGTYDELLAVAQWAEERGLVSFARSDHFYSSREPRPDATDAFATLAGLARETSSIRLAVLVSPITFRHPAVIAKNAATIDQMSGGRFDLGVGTGWMELEHDAFGLPFPPWEERFQRFEEALHYLGAAFTDGHRSFKGDHYAIDADSRPVPSGLRTIVGGSGAVRTPTLAGRHADEYNHFMTSPETLQPKIDVMRSAAEAAGRDPDAITISVMGPALGGADEASYRQRLAAAASERDIEPSEMEGRWAEQGLPLGTPDRLRSTIGGLEAVGVNLMYVQHIDLPDLDGLDETLSAMGA